MWKFREGKGAKEKQSWENAHNSSGTGNRWAEYLKLSLTDQFHSFFFFFYYESEWLTINNNARELLKNNAVINSVQNRTEIKKTPKNRVLKRFGTGIWNGVSVHGQPLHLWKYRTTASARKGKDSFWPQQPWGKSHISLFMTVFFFCERISYWLKEATDANAQKKKKLELGPQMKLDAQ